MCARASSRAPSCDGPQELFEELADLSEAMTEQGFARFMREQQGASEQEAARAWGAAVGRGAESSYSEYVYA